MDDLRAQGAWRRRFVLVAAALLLLAAPPSASGWGYGLNRVQTAAEDSAAHTGYGPGWVALTYKANGPVVGYLFAKNFRFSDGTLKGSYDHMDIRGTTDGGYGHPTIARWPWGYAHGGFGGCADAYGTSKFTRVGGFSSSRCTSGPSVPDTAPSWHSETVFCTNNAADPLCSPEGVWSQKKTPSVGGPLPVSSQGCQAYGNIGAAAAYGSGSPVPQHRLGYVPPGHAMDLRYVTKDRRYVMAKWNAGSFSAGIRWAFMPRSCVGQYGGGGGGSTSSTRIGVVANDGSVWVKQGPLDAQWTLQMGPGQRQVALSGYRVGIVTGDGAVYVKEGPLDAGWTLQMGPGQKQVALSGNRIGVLTGDGAVYVKEGPLDAGWTLQVGPGHKQVALSGNRIGVVGLDGAVYVKEGSLDAGWTTQLGPGQRHVNLSGNRIGALTGDGTVLVKEGALDAWWTTQLGPGQLQINLNGNRIGTLTGDRSIVVKEGSLDAWWTTQLGPGQRRVVLGDSNRIGALTGDGAAWVKEGSLDASWTVQVGPGHKSLALSRP